jgi:hypothetical protein
MDKRENIGFNPLIDKKLKDKELKILNKTLKRKKKDKVLNVLTLKDLEKWTDVPNIPLQNKNDKIKEVIILMAYLGLRVEEAIDFD